jgi:hypothetical protein
VPPVALPTTANTNTQQANSAYHTTSQATHAQFLHAMCGNPVPSTWNQAIDNGNFTTWPGLSSNLVRQHLPKSTATILGHMHQQRQNIRSTKTPIATTPIDTDYHPPSDVPNERSHLVFAGTIELRNEVATDLTGRFPVQSSRGHKYILILYDFDSNAILAKPMRN